MSLSWELLGGRRCAGRCGMTATVTPPCICGHVIWRHIGDTGRCRKCGRCPSYRPDDLDAAVQRHPSGRAHIPDHLRTDDLTAYRRQKGEL